MSTDWLEAAVRAAREVGAAPPLDGARTGARITLTLAARARRRRWVPLVGLAAAMLVGGAAWASDGPARLAAWLRREPRPAVVSSPSVAGAHSIPQVPVKLAATDESERRRVEEPDGARAVTAPEPARGAGPKNAPEVTHLPAKLAHVAKPASAPEREKPPERVAGDAVPPKESDLDLYTEAHALHFVAQDPARALVAWDRYLAIAPAEVHAGPVLEARYNRAICLVRLGRREDARAALAPFARGDYGDYRQHDARALLDSPLLRAATSSDAPAPADHD